MRRSGWQVQALPKVRFSTAIIKRDKGMGTRGYFIMVVCRKQANGWAGASRSSADGGQSRRLSNRNGRVVRSK